MPEPRRRLDAPETYTISVGWRVRWRQEGVGVRVAPPGWRLDGIEGAVEVAAGYSFACARTRDGAVWCWGDNSHGALGRETKDDHVLRNRPGLVRGIAV